MLSGSETRRWIESLLVSSSPRCKPGFSLLGRQPKFSDVDEDAVKN